MRIAILVRAGALVVLAGLFLVASGEAQTTRPAPKPKPKPKSAETTTPAFVPKFEVWAETRLLMEGLANSNYRGINRLLKNKPADNETWSFIRGQSLLLAETGNLLLLRPPRNSGRDTWMKLGMDMRAKAGRVARAAAARDYAGTKEAMTTLTASCNRCHETFRVAVKVAPEGEKNQDATE
jgi:hypothetical protein